MPNQTENAVSLEIILFGGSWPRRQAFAELHDPDRASDHPSHEESRSGQQQDYSTQDRDAVQSYKKQDERLGYRPLLPTLAQVSLGYYFSGFIREKEVALSQDQNQNICL